MTNLVSTRPWTTEPITRSPFTEQSRRDDIAGPPIDVVRGNALHSFTTKVYVRQADAPAPDESWRLELRVRLLAMLRTLRVGASDAAA